MSSERESSCKRDEAGLARRQAVLHVLDQVIERRARGEILPDSAVAETYPQLMPELREELGALRDIHRQMLAAQKAGPVSCP